MGGRRQADIISAYADQDVLQLSDINTRAGISITTKVNRLNSGDPALSFASLFEAPPDPTVKSVLSLMLPSVGQVTGTSSSSSSSSSTYASSGYLYGAFGRRTIGQYFDTVQSTTVSNSVTAVTGISINSYMNSRVINFYGESMRPNTRVYPLFDGRRVDSWVNQFNDSFVAKGWGQPLVTDGSGKISGYFWIPPSTFGVGLKNFKLSDNPDDLDQETTSAEGEYFSAGAAVYQRRLITQTTTKTTSRNLRFIGYYDPLAQSFFVDTNTDDPGMYVTSIDVYFKTKDTVNKPVTLEVREMVNGYPSPVVVQNGVAVLYPSEITVSTDSTSRTRFIFASPVFLNNRTEYCFVLKSDSLGYNVYIARLGEFLLNSTQTVAKQPYLGSMFVSQNDSTWTADQMADIKFVVNRAKFDTSKTAIASFNPIWPAYRTSTDVSIETIGGTSEVRIYALNHGLKVGSYTTVKIGMPIGSAKTTTGDIEPILNGIRLSNFNGFKKVTYADAYSFKVELNPDGTLTNDILATVSGAVPVNYLTFEPNIRYESFKFIGINDELPKTNMRIQYAGYSYPSIHGTQAEFVKDDLVDIPNDVEIGIPTPRVLTNYSDSYQNPALKGKVSAQIRTELSTTSEWVAPVLNFKDSRLITRSFILDNPTDEGGINPVLDYIDESSANDGIVASRYFLKPITLSNPARAIRVMLAGVVAEGNSIEVWWRTVASGSNKDIYDVDWTKMEFQTEPSIRSTVPDSFLDYIYEVKNTDSTPLDEFKTFAIKILLKGSNSSIPPKVKDLRIIALAN